MKVAVYAVQYAGAAGNKRAIHVAKAFARGLARHGVQHEILNKFPAGPAADLAVAYGWVHEPVFTAYRQAGAHFAYFDLGYWGRRPEGRAIEGYHRLAIDDWDTLKTMRRDCPGDRWSRLGVEIQAPLIGKREIIVAGMSGKAAGTHGFKEDQWETLARSTILNLAPEAEVTMRPKPNKRNRVGSTIEEALSQCKLLVTHHSNTALDALVAGVPTYCVKGVGRLASPLELTPEYIRAPILPDESVRRQIMQDAAYAQWSPEEMRTGEAWSHIREILVKQV